MSDQRPLGKIRMTRLRASGGETPEPTESGRHRRSATPQPPHPRIPAPRKPVDDEPSSR
jgi:hypothetical protein